MTPRLNRLARGLVNSLTQLMLFPAAAFTFAACASTDEPISIGLAGPLAQPHTGSMRQGAELAVAEINAAGGVRGRRIELVMRDDSGSATRAARVARGLADNPAIVAIVGHMTSGPTAAAAPVYNSGTSPVVHVSPSASSTEIADLGPYSFRICPDDRLHAAVLAEWARQEVGANSAAIIYHNSAQGRALSAAFRSYFTRSGGRVSTADPFVTAVADLEPYLTRLRVRGGTDALMIAGEGEDALRVAMAIDSFGVAAAAMGSAGLWSTELSPIPLEGTLVSTHYLPSMLNSRNNEFVVAYKRASGGREPDHRAAATYDVMHLLALAIESAGTARSSLRDYLAGIGTRADAFDGVTGRIAFDTRGNAVGTEVTMAVVRGGRLVAAER